MAITSYEYDWTDFPAEQDLIAERIQARIVAETEITADCEGVNIDGGVETVSATFARALSGAEQTALDAVVAAYVDETLPESKCACTCDCKAHLADHMTDDGSGNLVTELGLCDTAIANVVAAEDIAAAEAARDAYTGA